MKRNEMFRRAFDHDAPWDLVVIGGGASGAGVAVDAASRGYSVLLVEQSDFGKGTSSRSTKLAHGGVRYLQQGNVALVMEALQERGVMREIAPHLVSDLRFIVPNYVWWEAPFYGVGLKVYDMLARRYSFGPSKILSKEETLAVIPTLRTDGLRGGVQYYDGQFDDARLLINLLQTAAHQGAAVLNYAQVTGLTKDPQGCVTGVVARDAFTGRWGSARARCVINATGPFADDVRRMDDPNAAPMIAPSQGVHIVLDSSFLPGDSAIMVPHTRDGRVMFAIPWHGHALVGTTDTPVDEVDLEPKPKPKEIDFILDTAGRYLAKQPTKADVLSTFAGIRPLVRSGSDKDTAALSRDHVVHIGSSGLVTIAGGKWTTYRHMAEDCVNQAAVVAGLDEKPCVTRQLNIHGYHKNAEKFADLAVYGADAPAIRDLIRADQTSAKRLHPDLPIRAGQVVWAAQYEMAQTVEDFLARRTRALFLNARAAIQMAPAVAELLANELGHDQGWQTEQVKAFTEVAEGFLPT